MNNNTPLGPVIQPTTNFTTNFTKLLKVTDSLSTQELNIENISLKNGKLSGLNTPTNNDHAATLSYVQETASTTTGSSVGGPLGSLQYNDNGSFNGSESLKFNKTTNTLHTNRLQVGNVEISNNTVTGLTDPLNGSSAATKNYVDNKVTKVVINEVNGSTPVTYSVQDILNTVIYRNNMSSEKVVDVLPSAAEIVNYVGANVGTCLYIKIRNVNNSNYTNVVSFLPGEGITVKHNPNIYPGYQYNGILRITDITPGNESAKLYILKNFTTRTENYFTEIGNKSNLSRVVKVTDYVMDINKGDDMNKGITVNGSDASGRVIVVTEDMGNYLSLGKVSSFVGIFGSSNLITAPIIWKTGGLDFYIVNTTSTDVTLNTFNIDPEPIPWEKDPNSNFLVPSGHTGRFLVSITVNNYPSYLSVMSAKVYCLGVAQN